MSYCVKTGHLLQVGGRLAAPGGRSSCSECVVKMNMTNFSAVPLTVLVIESTHLREKKKHPQSLLLPGCSLNENLRGFLNEHLSPRRFWAGQP